MKFIVIDQGTSYAKTFSSNSREKTIRINEIKHILDKSFILIMS